MTVAVDELLSALNPRQREAVVKSHGPLLVLAGAGSGKTRVITYRIAYLLAAEGVAPEEILAVTFTNKAAGEMKRRIAALLPAAVRVPSYLGTFHSICARMLRRDGPRIGIRSDFAIFDSADSIALLREAMRELGIPEERRSAREFHAAISAAKNRSRMDGDSALDEIALRLFSAYQSKLRRANGLDFDDLLTEAVRLLESDPAYLDRAQDRHRFILVDEYQDTNFPQYRIVQLLASRERNLCVVGDDDQSIYAFRGADVGNILRFERDYPEAQVVILEQNYRSTQNILDGASSVILNNPRRRPKILITDRGAGERVVWRKTTDEEGEARSVCAALLEERRRGRSLSDCAVLYRTHAQSRPIEEALRRQTLPYLLVGGVRFYERKEVKDLLSYLRLVRNRADDWAFVRAIGVPPRGFGGTSASRLSALAAEQRISLFEAARGLEQESVRFPAPARRGLQDFIDLIEGVAANEKEGPSRLLRRLIEAAGFIEMLKKDQSSEAEERVANVWELVAAAQEAEEAGNGLSEFLDGVALLSEADEVPPAREGGEAPPDGGKVVLMTLHCAKGLEFGAVLMPGMEEGLFPHSRSLTDSKEMEEERRLCYVGMTRAKERLILFSAQARRLYGSVRFASPSRFLAEIPPTVLEVCEEPAESRVWPLPLFGSRREGREDPQFPRGLLLRHPLWGVGRVESAEGRGEEKRVTVVFPIVGRKKLAVKFAQLERME